ncbi:MAG TPA: glycerol-3-phosphate dehydrogenase/oxidase, partial [Gemmatimonadaceae bacterium]|nr:glycerol-3-phosphate dehydrogenase/oxidase [Gemmatimonadaceae bacterium]
MSRSPAASSHSRSDPAPAAPHRWREVATQRLLRETFDLVVIGGGITGAGVARDAALRGLRTALIEREDFASGTSSRSSRLIHGGVRYLEHGHLRLVFESSRERRTLLRIAPHLVRPLAFTWPVYRGARISRLKLAAGLALYDALALFRNVARHDVLSARGVLESEPLLRREALKGGARYFDASTDDARLTLANVMAARDAGAVVLNHAPVSALVRSPARVTGVEVLDTASMHGVTVRAEIVVNATGPWSDEIRRLESPAGPPTIRGAKGAHIAVPRSRVGNRDALALLHPTDGRVLFVVPAGEQAIVGTTETLSLAPPGQVRASREDVRYLLAAANYFFPATGLGERDVISAWAGIRPLAAALTGEETGSASREHAIAEGPGGMVHVTGGKLTTYRAMAEEIVDDVLRRLGSPMVRKCVTASQPLPGGEISLPMVREEARTITDPRLRDRLTASYGTRWEQVWSLGERDGRLRVPVADDVPFIGAEYVYAAAEEMAESLGDLLIRRTPAAFETRDHAIGMAPAVARLVAPVLE